MTITAKQLEQNVTLGEDGIRTVSIPGAFGLPVDCTYWEVDNVQEGHDRWRYKLTGYETIRNIGPGPFSHPNEFECLISIHKHFVEIGLITVPEDNSHLDEIDQGIALETGENYAAKAGNRPRVGDFVRFPDGTTRRCCNATDTGMQTTRAVDFSYSIGKFGGVSYSGGLDDVQLWERLKDTGETGKGRFWFFHHGRAGAGRGVDVFLQCKVFDLIEFNMTEQEARKHPAAIRAAEFWGEGHRDHVSQIAALMRGEAR